MNWWKVIVFDRDGISGTEHYCYGSDWKTAAAREMLLSLSNTVTAQAADPEDVPFRLRAKHEMTTEELTNILSGRGWKVTLS